MDTSTPSTQNTDLTIHHYPVLIKRIQSMLIDTVAIIIAMFAITWILDKFSEVPDWVRIVIFLGLWFVYEPLAMAFGCTLGNYVMKIRVRRRSNESNRINIFQSYLRFVIKLMLGWISFITVAITPKKQAIHDFAAGSVMIQV